MGCCIKTLMALFVLSGIGFAVLFAYLKQRGEAIQLDDLQYWGPKSVSKAADVPKDDEKVYQFKIQFEDKIIEDLRAKLSNIKYQEPLEDAKYHYGINGKTFKSVIDYWRTKYDFKKHVDLLNSYPHFRTQIEGLNIHFFRSRPTIQSASTKVIPILMIHGWPGSFVEFLKVASMLNKDNNGYAFDIIVPSLPGYGYSQASSKQGMNSFVTARMFTKLMKRLGYEKYYVQGGDWGSMITTLMAAMYPDNIKGIHLNMAFEDNNRVLSIARQVLFGMFPNYFGDGESPPCMKPCMKNKFMDLMRETGYLHIQATKPDTIGFALLNNPAGLAGYILEKFSTWTVSAYRELEDGGLTKKFTLDDILTNIMVYYVTDSIATSQRFYKENIIAPNLMKTFSRPITVPTGIAIFPNELSCAPRFVLEESYHNITHFTYKKDGGHFAAFEQPQLLTEDVRKFVEGLEKAIPTTWKPVNDFKTVA